MTRPFGAGARSAIWPGWGQLSVGDTTLGWSLAAGAIIAAGAAVIVILPLDTADTLAHLTDTNVLLGLAMVNLLVAGVRIGATSHAWWRAGGSPLGVGLIALVAFVGLPHLWLGATVAGAQQAIVAVTAAVPPPPPTEGSPSTTSAPTTTVAPTGQRLTVLLVGSDAGPGRVGVRTDTVIVATVDTASGDAALFGLPRNLTGLRLPDGTPLDGLLNEVYANATDHLPEDTAPDIMTATGMEALRAVAEDLIDLPIDHWAMIDLTGFARVVDALGGVTVTLPEPLAAPLWNPETGKHTRVVIPAGEQRLDGDHALAFVRTRTDGTDYQRMARQRCLLGALVDQVDVTSLVVRLPTLLESVAGHLTTDIPRDTLPDLVRLAARMDRARLIVVGFDPAWAAMRTADGYPIVDRAAVRTAVFQTVVDQELAEIASGLETAEGAC